MLIRISVEDRLAGAEEEGPSGRFFSGSSCLFVSSSLLVSCCEVEGGVSPVTLVDLVGSAASVVGSIVEVVAFSALLAMAASRLVGSSLICGILP